MKITFKMLMLQSRGTIAATPAAIAATAGTPQSANCGAPFTARFEATVTTAGGVGVPGVSITFTAPGSGASGTFANGLTSETVLTNGSGVATSSVLTAGTAAGAAFTVTATTGALSCDFSLTSISTAQRIAALSGIVAYYPMADTSGTDIAESIAARNGTANNLTLNNFAGPYPDMGNAPLFNGSSSFIQLPSATLNTVFSAAEGTIAIWHRINGFWNDGTTQSLFAVGADGNNRFNIIKVGASLLNAYNLRGGTSSGGNVAHWAGGWHCVALEWKKSANSMRYFMDGVLVESTTLPGTWAGALADAFTLLGAYNGTFFFNGWLQNAMIFNRVLTDAEHMQIASFILTLPQVVCDGDSLTAGYFATSPYPEQLLSLLGNSRWRIVNHGIGYKTIAAMVTDASTYIYPQYSASRSKNILVILGGTNDLGAGATDTTTYNNIVTYCQNGRTAGFKVLVCDIPPRADGAWTAGMETYRQSVNASIAANHATFADGYVALTARPNLQNPNNTTYFYTDKLHLTTAGDGEIAAAVYAQAILQ